MQYKGVYRDGKSSRDYAGEIRFEGSELSVSYEDNEGKVCVVVWPRARVSLAEGSKPEKVILLHEEGRQGSFVFSADEGTFREVWRMFGKRDLRRHVWLFSLIGLGIVLFWFLGLPVLVDVGVDILMGQERGSQEILTSFEEEKVSSWGVNETASRNLQLFVAKYISEDFPPVMVIDLPVENAFATPWGNILVTERMFSLLENPDELVALLYHEEGHLVYHHPLKMILRQHVGSFFLLLLSGGNDISQILLGTGEQLLVLRYSRGFEMQADKHAVNRLISQGFDPGAMERLLRSFQQEEEKEFFSLFSTHPSLETRISLIQKYSQGISVKKKSDSSQEAMERDFRALKVLE
ncbi:MAG: M48 family metallopeptidase [Brevinematales bacterium]|nr:M48 family metallopeptidase [Brevinematales bacterium]